MPFEVHLTRDAARDLEEIDEIFDDPQYAATGTMACKSCHSPGRLTARLREIGR